MVVSLSPLHYISTLRSLINQVERTRHHDDDQDARTVSRAAPILFSLLLCSFLRAPLQRPTKGVDVHFLFLFDML